MPSTLRGDGRRWAGPSTLRGGWEEVGGVVAVPNESRGYLFVTHVG